MKTEKTGFTLIELLCVVSIIILLAALLLPMLAKVKEKSKEVQCGQNLRELGMAAISYANDYNQFPICGYITKSSKTFNPYEAYHILLAEYLGYGSIFDTFSGWNAFSLNEVSGEGWALNDPHRPRGVWNCPASDLRYYEYASNINTFGRSVASLRFPSNIIILADGWKCLGGPMYESDYPAKPYTGLASWYWLKLLAIDTPGPHGNYNNLLFGDLHVDKMTDNMLVNIDGYFASSVAKYTVPSGECK